VMQQARLLVYMVLLGKLVPFPFFIPPYVILMGYMIYAASKGMERMCVVAFLAFHLVPYATMQHQQLADIETWGSKGPNAAPMKGVYMFNGLPFALIDFSHCLYDDSSRIAHCHLPKTIGVWPGGLNLTAAGFDMTADGGDGGPGKSDMEVTMPWQVFHFFYHVVLHNRLDFHFDETLTEAQVYENVCLSPFASPSPLAHLFPHGICTTASVYPFFRVFTMVSDGGSPPTWYRNTYYQEKSLMDIYSPIKVADKQARSGGTVYPAKMQWGDGYKLEPLLVPGAGGKPKLHAANLKKMSATNPYILMRDI